MTTPAGEAPDVRLQAIRARLKAATPGPWRWGDGWAGLDYQGSEGGGDKYADLMLRGPDADIIPLRIDHYEPIWDCADPNEEPSAANRDFIAHAPEDIAFLLELVGASGAPGRDATGEPSLRDRDELWCRALTILDPRDVQRVTTAFLKLRRAPRGAATMSDAPYYCPHGRAYYEMCLQCPTESERHMEKQMVTRHGSPFPRRNCIDLYCPAETAISAARDAVERAGAHPLLTDALNLLNQAQERVADWYEGRARTALREGRPE